MSDNIPFYFDSDPELDALLKEAGFKNGIIPVPPVNPPSPHEWLQQTVQSARVGCLRVALNTELTQAERHVALDAIAAAVERARKRI